MPVTAGVQTHSYSLGTMGWLSMSSRAVVTALSSLARSASKTSAPPRSEAPS